MIQNNASYWHNKYISNATGWDLGKVSPPLKSYFDQLEDKSIKILIPGAGNSYEAQFLFENGFTNIYILDIAKPPLDNLKRRVPNFPESSLIHKDFFKYSGQFDLIVEQTFFCALPPKLRPQYVQKMYKLLKSGGTLVGLLFSFPLTKLGPPFGGSKKEYIELFKPFFDILILEASYNSHESRKDKELFFKFRNKV